MNLNELFIRIYESDFIVILWGLESRSTKIEYSPVSWSVK